MAAPFGSFVLAVMLAAAAPAVSAGPCRPPAGFKDAPHPQVAPLGQLVSHTEQIVIDRPLQVVAAVMHEPLQQALRKSASLPGVSGEYVLTRGDFGMPGSRRIVCLTDGGMTEEEPLAREQTKNGSRFRYVVWNYSTPKARPIEYGVGEFRVVQLDESHTQIRWTYAFRLKEDVFPGQLGAFGRWLFRVGFLDRDYAAMMRATLQGYKDRAENRPASTGGASKPSN